MQRVPVDSSSIASVGYEPGQRILEVEFKESGEVYQYLDVPEDTYEAFTQAESLGKFLNASIRGVFQYRRV